MDAAQLLYEAEKERDIAQTLGPENELEAAWLVFVSAVEQAAREYMAVADRFAVKGGS